MAWGRRFTPTDQLWAGGLFLLAGGVRLGFAVDLDRDPVWLLIAAMWLTLGTGLVVHGLRRRRRGDDGSDPWAGWAAITAVVVGVGMMLGSLTADLSRHWALAGALVTALGVLFLARRRLRRPVGDGPGGRVEL